MADASKIEWTDATHNHWIGCTKISPACDHCYAEAQNDFRKWNKDGWGPHSPRHLTSAANRKRPYKWNREAEEAGVRRRVFCSSLSDVFDTHRSILTEWRSELLKMIEDTPWLDWQMVTKRPQNVAKLVPQQWMGDGFPQNVWLGISVENQTEADRRIPILLDLPARVRFLSCEPLLGPLDLTAWLWGRAEPCPACPRDVDCDCGWSPRHLLQGESGLSWVIAGGESGPNARPSNPQWFRDLRDQCAAADVPFLFKQWGEWVSVSEVEGPGRHYQFEDGRTVRRTGKKRAGRTLDGVMHDSFPNSAAFEK